MAYSPEIQKIHDRTLRQVKKMWGPASNYQCLLCFDPAAGWAWLHRTHPPDDPEGFAAMCRRDHDDYDDVAEQQRLIWADSERRTAHSEIMRKLWTPERRAAQSERARQWSREQWADPAYRALRSERALEQWTDPQHRARISERARQRMLRQWRPVRYVVPPRRNPPDPRRTVPPTDQR